MHNIYLYILLMAAVTYLIRALPLTLIRRELTNPFLKSFIYYVPYTTLAAMTFPAILFSTGELVTAAAGFAAAVVLAYRNRSLMTVAAGAVCGVLAADLLLRFFVR
jgi:branched-subunit amino acid transport protein